MRLEAPRIVIFRKSGVLVEINEGLYYNMSPPLRRTIIHLSITKLRAHHVNHFFSEFNLPTAVSLIFRPLRDPDCDVNSSSRHQKLNRNTNDSLSVRANLLFATQSDRQALCGSRAKTGSSIISSDSPGLYKSKPVSVRPELATAYRGIVLVFDGIIKMFLV